MKKIFPRLLAAGASLLAGCSSAPIMVGRPGHLRVVAPVELESAPGEQPAYCVISLGNPASEYAAHYLLSLRDVRFLTRERPGPEGCDVLLKVTMPGVWVPTVNSIEALSAYDASPVWEGTAGGLVPFFGESRYGLELLIPHMIGDLRPGRPAYEKIASGRASGRRLNVDGVEGLAGLVSESFLNPDLRAQLRFGRPRPSAAAAAAPAPMPAAVPTAVLSDVDGLPAKSASRRGHAVVIGIERYRQSLPKADFAASDARVMAKYASAAFGYPEENIALLTDASATKGDFEKYFERWLPNRVEKDDEVFVYFSGHGSPNPKNGDAYLVPFDGDPTYLAETGFSLKRLYAALAKLPAKTVTVALDSCFSGAGGRSVLAQGARPLVVKQAEAAPAGVTVLSASAGDQISNTYNEQGHGLFTYFLLKGLKEKGADLRAAFDYAKPEVSKVARRQYNADQEPQWREGH